MPTKKTQPTDTIIRTSGRMKKSVHKQLKLLALENDKSLNQLLDKAIGLIIR